MNNQQNESATKSAQNSVVLKQNKKGKKCIFCLRCKHSIQFTFMVNRALFAKYSASQNYYYSKDINNIITDQRSIALIKYKDFQCYDDNDEFLKRFYYQYEYKNKNKALTEYYKFHNDITRLFMLPITLTLNKYHDRKRKIEYIKITKFLEIQEEKANGKNNKRLLSKVQDKQTHFLPIQNPILQDLEKESIQLKNRKTSKNNNTMTKTIYLNNKLSDIINTSQYSLNMNSSLHSNLNSFIKFVSKSQKKEMKKEDQIFSQSNIMANSSYLIKDLAQDDSYLSAHIKNKQIQISNHIAPSSQETSKQNSARKNIKIQINQFKRKEDFLLEISKNIKQNVNEDIKIISQGQKEINKKVERLKQSNIGKNDTQNQAQSRLQTQIENQQQIQFQSHNNSAKKLEKLPSSPQNRSSSPPKRTLNSLQNSKYLMSSKIQEENKVKIEKLKEKYQQIEQMENFNLRKPRSITNVYGQLQNDFNIAIEQKRKLSQNIFYEQKLQQERVLSIEQLERLINLDPSQKISTLNLANMKNPQNRQQNLSEPQKNKQQTQVNQLQKNKRNLAGARILTQDLTKNMPQICQQLQAQQKTTQKISFKLPQNLNRYKSQETIHNKQQKTETKSIFKQQNTENYKKQSGNNQEIKQRLQTDIKMINKSSKSEHFTDSNQKFGKKENFDKYLGDINMLSKRQSRQMLNTKQQF